MGECGDQWLGGSGGGGPGIEPLRLAQQCQRLDRVCLLLRCEGERRRDPAGEVRADRLPCGGGVEDRPVRDVPVQRVGVVVVGLGQPPPVVVADERALLVARAETDLQVQREGRLVPHLVQPRDAVARLVDEALRRPAAQQSCAGEEHDVVVRRGVGELEVVAGVRPAALDVNRSADPREVRVCDHVLAPDHVRPGIDVGRRVVEVRGLAAQRTGDLLVAVALVLVEAHAEVDQRSVELAGTRDPEVRRGHPNRPGRDDPVAALRPKAGEVQPVDVGEPAAPAARRAARDRATQEDLALLADHGERRVPERAGGHQHRRLGLARQPALLVDPQLSPNAGRRRGR